MRKGYIQFIHSAIEFQTIMEEMGNRGISPDNIILNVRFEDFIKSCNFGDTIILNDLSMFRNMSDLLRITIELTERGVSIESLSDEWFVVSADNLHLLKGLMNTGLKFSSERPKNISQRVKAVGKKLGRPYGSRKEMVWIVQEVDRLRKARQISVVNACEIVGCLPRTYYRYLKMCRPSANKIGSEVVD